VISLAPTVDPGSFRDPDSRVFYENGTVYRLLSPAGLRAWEAFAATSVCGELLAEEKIVTTERVETDVLPRLLPTEGAAVLRHERIPFVSYPYEWCFGMLQDAALLQLELLERALPEGFVLKDASPYNVHWRGAQPVFGDIGSFEHYGDGEPWAGYRQFCSMFLYPLLLQAHRGIPFQPWLRGSLEGISPDLCARILSRRDRLRRGVFTHVVVHNALERRYARAGRAVSEVKREVRQAGFSRELILANVRKLTRLVRQLSWAPEESTWSAYTATTSYSEADAGRKAVFVERAAASGRWRLAWDIGANDGRHARRVAPYARYTVALDGDPVVVERLYRALRSEGSTTILPLCMSVTDPSPGLGWRGRERRPLIERGSPDLVLCLALLHHVAIGGNVPVEEVVDWLWSLGARLVVEFATPDDPMVRGMLDAKPAGTHPDYRRDWFERCLTERFTIEATEELAGGNRVLYDCRRVH
jgi:hypothetical protein